VIMRVDGDTRPLVMLRLEHFIETMKDKIQRGVP
jgi:hypothetical protein